jgi:multiple sugar transport system substrate-binding protein
MTMKLKLAAGAATLSMLALVGCGGGGGGGASSASGGKTALTWFMWSGSDVEVQAWKHVGAMVTQKYPKITVKFQTTSFPDYWTKLAAQASGGDAACILGMQSLRTPGLGQLLKPLDDLAKQNGVDMADFDKSITDGLSINGKLVAVPYDLGPLVVFYNKTAFKKAGVPEPKPGWTVQDFLSAGKSLTSGKKYGFAAFPLPDWMIPWGMSLYGVNPVSDAGKATLTAPDFVKAMQWYVDLVQKEKIAPQVPATNDYSWPVNQFLSGNVAMVVDGPWDLINTKSQAKFDVGIVPMPAGDSGSKTVSAGSGFGISASCNAPEEAMKAISVITGPEAQQYLGEQGRAFPARIKQQQYWYKNAVPGAKATLEAASASAVPYRTTAKWNQVTQLLVQYGIEAMNGQSSVEKVLQNVQQQAG